MLACSRIVCKQEVGHDFFWDFYLCSGRVMTYLWAVIPVLFYPSVLFLLSFESVQRHAIYVHAVNWPLFASYTSPEYYGF